MEDQNTNKFSTADQDLSLNQYSSLDSDGELLILNVDIGEGAQKQLIVHENDNIEELAFRFCQEHELNVQAKLLLIEEIEKNLQNIYNQSLSRIPESSQQIISINNSLKIEAANKGCELYLRGLKMREKTEQKRQKFKKERENNEVKEATFKPLTNSPDKRQKAPEQILLEKGKQTAESLNKKRAEIEKKLMNECTFSPEVNKKSAFVKSSQLRSPDRYMYLYQDAQSIQEKILRKSQEL